MPRPLIAGYIFHATTADWVSIHWVGDRYSWSETLARLATEESEPEPGDGFALYHLSAANAWEWRDAVEADTIGGHSPFPCLDPSSSLHSQLSTLVNAIV